MGAISKQLDQVVALSDVRARPAGETEAKKSRYGRMVPQAADAAIEMVESCTEPFKGLARAGRTVQDRLRFNSGKAAYLQGVLAKLGDVTQRLQSELNGTNNELLGDIEDCRRTMAANLDNPAARGPQQDQLASASTKLRGLLELRNQSFQTHRDATGTLRDAVEEKESEVADLDQEVARKDVELKFHTGGELTPDDVIVTPRPLAAPAAFTAPRTARARTSSSDAGPAPRGPGRGRRKSSR